MQRHSTASCFATYLLPHVLFVADPEERGRIAGACCLAWNIALFPDARERERHIERTLDLILDDGAVPPPPAPVFAGTPKAATRASSSTCTTAMLFTCP